MRTIIWALSAAVIGILGASRAQAEPCGTPPLVDNADCIASKNPYVCCTGAGTGTCVDPGVVAPNCIDCSVPGGCTVYKYGLGHPDNFTYRRPTDASPPLDDSDFPNGSYVLIRSDPNSPTATHCWAERDFVPIQGQVRLREQTNCEPTSEGPTGPGGCPVEIPRAISGVDPARDKTTWSNATHSTSGVTTILGSSSATLGGTSNPSNPQCLPTSIRLVNSQGTRYLLPAARGGDGTKTYIQWRDVAGEGLFRHEDDSEFCCTSTTSLGCAAVGGFPEYPVMLARTCATPGGRIYQLLDTNDWIFDGGPGTPFITDPEHIVTGQIHGVCRINRFQGCTRPGTNSVCTGLRTPHICCLGAGTGTCGTECVGLDGDPETPGIQDDTCDLRERGLRQTRPGNLGSGFPNPTICSTVIAVIRGTPDQYCTINTKYAVNGDPGADCQVWNFGFHPRPDLDCDGVEDVIPGGGAANDLCPFFNEFDYFKDTDGDCAGGTARCRGDECECGDQNVSGRVNVEDLVAINSAIFDPAQKRSICDANNDLQCNVADIVGANGEIFDPDSSACRHLTSVCCGNSVTDLGEACDDGARCQGGPTPGVLCNATPAATCGGTGVASCGAGGTCIRIGGDGCNTSCRLEN